MRILFISSLYSPYIGGGAEITLSSLVNGMKQRGHEVAVLTTINEKGLKISNENGVTIYRAGIRNIYWHFTSRKHALWQKTLWHIIDSFNPIAKRDIREVITHFKPDIVSCHNLPGFSWTAWCVTRMMKIPTIQVLHDYYSICPKSTAFNKEKNCITPCALCSFLRLPHQRLSNNISAVVGVSKAVLERQLDAGFFTSVPIKRVIYNARQPLQLAQRKSIENTLTFGFIGALTVVKGIKQLLESFTRVANQNKKKMKLLIAGTGKSLFVNELKNEFGSDDRIVFLGQVNPENFYNQIDVTVVPSVWHEPLGSVVIESIGHSVPVIATNRGGTNEMIKHEFNGLLYEPDELYELDNALKRVIDDPQLLAEMKKNTLPSAEKFLNLNRMLDEHQSLYKSIIQNY